MRRGPLGAVANEMGLRTEPQLHVVNLQLGRCQVCVAGPDEPIQILSRVLAPLALSEDNLPSLQLTIAPNRAQATGTVYGDLQWSVVLPQQGWLSVLVGQVVATMTTFLQRFLFLHAGAVAINGRGWVIVGDSGAGKTSAVASLVRRGEAYLSDEVALLDPITRHLMPFALPLAVKPWTAKAVGTLPIGHEVAQDGVVRFYRPAALVSGPVPTEAFVLLRPTRGSPRLTPISRAEMLLALAHRPSSFSYRHRAEAAFAGFGHILQTARCYVLEGSPAAASTVLLSAARASIAR